MALLNSLFSGVSGLQNLQSMMDVIGNNIANVDTIGFKSSRVTFSDTFNELIKSGTNPTSTTGGTNSFQVGLGMKINSIDRNWNQGTFQTTGISTDLALQGPGMFILNSNGQNFYSRAGSFIFDANGKLVDPQNGAVVQGKVANGLGQIPQGTAVQDVVVDKNLKLPAIKTSNVSWSGNLQSSSATVATNVVNMNDTLAGNSPTNGTTLSSSSTIVGKNGANYTLDVTYTYASATSSWTPSYTIKDSTGTAVATTDSPALSALTYNSTGNCTSPSISVTSTDPQQNLAFTLDFSKTTLSSTASTPTSIPPVVNQGASEAPVIGSVSIYDSLGNSHTLSLQFDHSYGNTWSWKASVPSTDGGTFNGPTTGTITFDANGQIQSITQGGVTVPGNPPVPQVMFTPSGGAETEPINLNFGSGTAGITQTSLSSQVAALKQDGSASANLTNLNVDQYGNVVGVFSNGNSETLAQIMVATFTNQNALVSAGDNLYSVAANSGNPLINAPGSSSATTIQSGALEQSNVDLSQEFTQMIVSQRGFEANAKVVTTSDTLLQDITNLVR